MLKLDFEMPETISKTVRLLREHFSLLQALRKIDDALHADKIRFTPVAEPPRMTAREGSTCPCAVPGSRHQHFLYGFPSPSPNLQN